MPQRSIFSIFKIQNMILIFLVISCYHTFNQTSFLLNKILLYNKQDQSNNHNFRYRKIMYSLIFNLVCSCIFLFDLIIHFMSLYYYKELKTKFIFYLNGPILFILSISSYSFICIVFSKTDLETPDDNLKTFILSLLVSFPCILLWYSKVCINMFAEFHDSYRFIKFGKAVDFILSKIN